MFQQNVEFRVTIRDFQDRAEPHVLKKAGPQFVRAIRECSAEYLENCFREEGVVDVDADLRWTVTLHPKLGVGTIHYAVYRPEVGFEGKCLVWDLNKGPVPNRPWTPINMRNGELRTADTMIVDSDWVSQPEYQNFFAYYFKGWIPVSRITADMVEEDTERTLIGAGFSPDLVLGTPDFPEGMAKTLEQLRAVHNAVVSNSNSRTLLRPGPQMLAGREYEFDLRPAKNSLAMKVNYLKVAQVTDPAVEEQAAGVTSFEAVFQEGGWLDGAFAKDAELPQFVSLASWMNSVDFDTL